MVENRLRGVFWYELKNRIGINSLHCYLTKSSLTQLDFQSTFRSNMVRHTIM